ncbi:pantothenate kinase [Phytopseudomonas dryadis]|uniref:Type III pantothenate kinase n=1 Tax=Phytopseudomonas dryadis TaxID=2487520 RepID=A0A4Q9R7B9_9GAMM|nr:MULTISPECIES: pantothenate kinase [Pseudomonas]TBU95971.1 pantothenate kinase [Pseudomonas dryadis]TBV09132.1 pantothenate kinase [Pseudomonas dryadis]TBV18347.1 pantothenate kinase [Pseudomonas sp. FRB 230]
MILELDCGNSFIKWRVVHDRDVSQILAGGIAGDDRELLQALRERFAQGLSFCRLVSVRTDEETALLVAALRDGFAIDCLIAAPSPQLAGVSNGYDEYQRLGLDRWLAVVGAYSLVGRACLILDLGTAITSDFVERAGRHLGGFICPGMPLMRNQLRTHTRRIRYDDVMAERAQHSLAPGRSTAEAVERGCLLMLRGFVSTQLELAREQCGEEVEVFLTGGDAALVAEWVPAARVMPDLVFVGLAIACPLPSARSC